MQSKERAKELYGELAFENIRVNVIHSDLSQIEVIFLSSIDKIDINILLLQSKVDENAKDTKKCNSK